MTAAPQLPPGREKKGLLTALSGSSAHSADTCLHLGSPPGAGASRSALLLSPLLILATILQDKDSCPLFTDEKVGLQEDGQAPSTPALQSSKPGSSHRTASSLSKTHHLARRE